MADLKNNLENVDTVESVAGFKPVVVPEEITRWTKIRNFLFQEITITLTPKQEKVFQEVHDFWHQDVTAQKIHDFWFQEIKIIDNITL